MLNSFSGATLELFLAASVLALILISAMFYKADEGGKFHFFYTIAVLIVGIFISASESNISYAQFSFNELFISSKYTAFAKIILCGSGIATSVFASSYSEKNASFGKNEFSILMLIAILGACVMVSANNFMSFYLGLELQNLALYTLASFDRSDLKSSESGLKYFILSAIASAILLYGISLIYGASGSVDFGVLSSAKDMSIGFVVGFVFVLIGIAFKISAAPMHFWSPDVYQGAPLPVTLFLTIMPKIALVFFSIKFLGSDFASSAYIWKDILKLMAILSLFIGALGALRQENIKRLLAYSSINHIGFILLGITAFSIDGVKSSIIYMIIYITMNVGVFAFISILQKKDGRAENFDISIFAGLSKHHPIIAFSIAVLMLSMAGVPPLAGFFAKFYVLTAVVKSSGYVLAVIAVISTIVSTFYYLKIIKLMYFDTSGSVDRAQMLSMENIILASAATTFNILFMFAPSALNLISGYI